MSYRTAKIYPSYEEDTNQQHGKNTDDSDELFTTEVFSISYKQEILTKGEQTGEDNKQTLGRKHEKYKLSKDIMSLSQCGDSFSNLSDFDLMVIFDGIPKRELYKVFNNVNKVDLQILKYKNKTLFDILQRAHLRKLRQSHYDLAIDNGRLCC